MEKKRNTPLNACLAEMDEAMDPDGSRKVFAIGFYTGKGEFVYLPKAVKSGLNQDQKGHDYKGVAKVDDTGEKLGHPYPVWIHAIAYFKSAHFEFKAHGNNS